jgi:phage terminase small subunit
MGALEPRQAAFVREYIVDFNGTRAALRAGYAESGASTAAARLLANDKVAAEVAKAVKLRERRTAVTADRVVLELARLGFLDPRNLFAEDGTIKPVSEWGDDLAAAIASIEVEELFDGRGDERKLTGHLKKVRFWDKGRALDILAKHTGVYRDNILQIINVIQSPQWVELRAVLVLALEPYPKARAAVLTALVEHAGADGTEKPAAG